MVTTPRLPVPCMMLIWSPMANTFGGIVSAIAAALLRVTSLPTSPTAAVYVVPVCALIATTAVARIVALAAVNISPGEKVGLTLIMLLL